MQTWLDIMPNYSVQVWSEAHLDRTNRYIDIAYRLGRYAFVADYVRLSVLYEGGGIYLDTDVEVLKPFDGLLDHRLFLGLQSPGSIGAGVIGAVKGHPFLRLALDQLEGEARSGQLTFQPLPDLLTALMRSTSTEKPVLLPEDYFYPYNPYSPSPLRQKPLQSHLSDRTVCIHHWEGTWLGSMSLRAMIRSRIKEGWRRVSGAVRPRSTLHEILPDRAGVERVDEAMTASKLRGASN